MKKDVLISVKGLQLADDTGEEEPVEIITPGSYYKKNNSHYVMYDEVVEGSDEVIKNLIRFRQDFFSVTKRGYTNVDMVFEKNKRNMANYMTPYGSLLIGIDTDEIQIDEQENGFSIAIDYSLDIEYQRYADCRIEMTINPKTEENTRRLLYES